MNNEPKVLIVMGSDSDLPVMRGAKEVLNKMGVPCIMEISSAHRVPQQTADLAKSARNNGFEVIIAGAGMAAHLAGAIAAHTTLPVIGVPLSSKTATHAVNGLDSLLSTVQMPPGIPVATVGIDRADNAAYLACSILSIRHPQIENALYFQRKEMQKKIEKAAKKLREEEEGK